MKHRFSIPSLTLLLSLLPFATTQSANHSPVSLAPLASGFVSPIALASYPDDSGRLLVVDQIGIVHLVQQDGSLAKIPFLDLRGHLAALNENAFDERGLLGLALHPKFKENRKLFVFYSAPLRDSAPEGWDHTSRISSFQVYARNDQRVDLTTEKVILEIDQPQFNHNCGRIAFGPDGYLYIGVGDGGNAKDEGLGHAPQGNGQDLSTLLGKILRIHVDCEAPYTVPSDNPFVNVPNAKPEIFAYGVRNPWGISFDQGGSHALFAADVGQDLFEEVNIITKGGNYGWRVREGRHYFNPADSTTPPTTGPTSGPLNDPLIDPILEYKNINRFRNDPNAFGICIIGGYVYRGKSIPNLTGTYVFADWTRNWVLADGTLLAGTPQADESWTLTTLPVTGEKNRAGAYITGLGQDHHGEIYIMTNDSNSLRGETGKLHKLVPAKP